MTSSTLPSTDCGSKYDAIARIAGVGVRLPHANNLDELSDILQNKCCVLTEPRWAPHLYGMHHLCGLVNPIGMIDCEEFEISLEEAACANPMLGPLLEVVAECMLDAGFVKGNVSKYRTGFYLGVTFCDTDVLITNKTDTTSNFLNTRTELCARVSHMFNLKGPVMQVDGACASSFAAMHAALLDLHSGRCELAIVAGSNLLLDPTVSLQFDKLKMLSPKGNSAPFDESADGYVRSEGIVAILLKPAKSEIISKAYCDVVGFGLECDGAREKGMLHPNSKFQYHLLTNLYSKYNINVDDIVYFEAHGTSTQKGDKAELLAIDKAICSRRTKPLLVGSIKGNIGHTEASAGLAGILKCLASYRRKVIFGNVNMNTPNRSISSLHTGNIVIPISTNPLPKEGPNLMCISSYGFGGLGGHIVLSPCQPLDCTRVTYPVFIPCTLHPKISIETLEADLRKEMYNPSFYNYFLNSDFSDGSSNHLYTYLIADPNKDELIFPSCQHPTIDEVTRINVVFMDFFNVEWTPHVDILNIPIVLDSLSKSEKVLKELQFPVSFQSLLKSTPTLNVLESHGVLLRVACLLAIVDLLSVMDVLDSIRTLNGQGIGSLVVGYADGCLTRVQCLKIAMVIERMLVQENAIHKDTTILKVNLDVDSLYTLGPWVQILKWSFGTGQLIAVLQNMKDHVIQTLQEKGEPYAVQTGHIAIYSSQLKHLEQPLMKSIFEIIPSPMLWSARVEIPQVKKRGNDLILCDAAFFAKLLTSPYLEETEHCPYSAKFLSPQDLDHASSEFKNIESSSCETASSDNSLNCSTRATCGSLPSESPHSKYKAGYGMSSAVNQSSMMFDLDILEDDELDEDPDEDQSCDSVTFVFFLDHPETPPKLTTAYEEKMWMFKRNSRSSMKGSEAFGEIISIGAHQLGFLTTLGHVHLTGFTVQAVHQLVNKDGISDYCGDFPSHKLWAWVHTGKSAKFEWGLKQRTNKALRNIVVREFQPSDYPLYHNIDTEIIRAMFDLATDHLDVELKRGKVLYFDLVKVIDIDYKRGPGRKVGHIFGRVFHQSQEFCVERVGRSFLQGHYQLLETNPIALSRGKSPFSVPVEGTADMLRNLLIIYQRYFDMIGPLRMMWDKARHEQSLEILQDFPKDDNQNINCILDANAGTLLCGGFMIKSQLPKANPEDLKPVDHQHIVQDSCAYCETLQHIQGSSVSHLLPKPLESTTPDEKKIPKQVRFSIETIDVMDIKQKLPSTPVSTKKIVFPFSFDDFDEENFETCEGAQQEILCPEPSEDVPRDYLEDSIVLNAALSLTVGDNFHFVENLNIDEMLSENLLNRLGQFALGTTLYVFITPSTSPSSASQFVLYMYRDESAVEDNTRILVRDRNLDLITTYSCIALALSHVSTFVEDLSSTHVARIYAVLEKDWEDDSQISSWEPILLGTEMEMLAQVNGDFVSENQGQYPCLPSDCDVDETDLPQLESLCLFDEMGPTSPAKFNTSFYLCIDDKFEETLSKLVGINGHIVALVQRNSAPQKRNEDCPVIVVQKDYSSLYIYETSNGKGVRLVCSDTMPSSWICSSLQNDLSHSCTSILKDDRRNANYLISIIGSHVQGEEEDEACEKLKITVYLYSEYRSVVKLNSIGELVEHLKVQHPTIDQSHEVLVSTCHQHTSFDELLYHFWNGLGQKQESYDFLSYNGNADTIKTSFPNESSQQSLPITQSETVVDPVDKLEQFGFDEGNAHSRTTKKVDPLLTIQINEDLPAQELLAICSEDNIKTPVDRCLPKVVITPSPGQKQALVNKGCTVPKNASPATASLSSCLQVPELIDITKVKASVPGYESPKAEQRENIRDLKSPTQRTHTKSEESGVYELDRSFSPQELVEDSDTTGAITISLPQGSVASLSVDKQDQSPGTEDDSADHSVHSSCCQIHVMGYTKILSERDSSSSKYDSADTEVLKIMTNPVLYSEESSSGTSRDSGQSSSEQHGDSLNSSEQTSSEQHVDSLNSSSTASSEQQREISDWSSCVKYDGRDLGGDGLIHSKVTMAMVVHMSDHKRPVEHQHGRAVGNLLIYQATKGDNLNNVLGFILFSDLGVHHATFQVGTALTFSHLENCLSILMSMYIIEEAGPAHHSDNKNKRLLVEAPVPVLMFLANRLGYKQILTSSGVPFIRDLIHNIVPNAIVLPDPASVLNVLTHTQGNKCDVVVMLQQEVFEDMLNLVGLSGSLVLCGKINPLQEVGMNCFLQNITIHSFDACHAVRHYMMLEDAKKAEFERDFSGHIMAVTDAITADYPARSESMFYNVLGKLRSITPESTISEDILVQMFLSNTMTSDQIISTLRERQARIALYLYARMVRPFNIDPVRPNLSNDDILDLCLDSTPDPSNKLGPDQHMQESSRRSGLDFYEELFRLNEPSETKTPVIKYIPCDLDIDLLSLERGADRLAVHRREDDSSTRLTVEIEIPVLLNRGFQVPGSLQDITNTSVEHTVVKLNDCTSGVPLYIVHDVTGTVDCLKCLAQNLTVPVFGIQCSSEAPITSEEGISALARFYLGEIRDKSSPGPLSLGGYSFGAVIAYEMASILEHTDKGLLHQVVLLDGSPHYVMSWVQHELTFVPRNRSHYERFLVAVLLSFIRLYLPDFSTSHAASLLASLTSCEQQIVMAVDISLGYVKLDVAYGIKEKWRLLSDRMKKKEQLREFRKSILSSRSSIISCNSCQRSLSSGSYLLELGLFSYPDVNLSVREARESCDGIEDKADGAEDAVFLSPTETMACNPYFERGHGADHHRELRKAVPEFYMVQPACSLGDVSDRVLLLLRRQKAEMFLRLGLMMRKYKAKPLRKTPTILVRAKSTPKHLEDLDLEYGLRDLVKLKKFHILFADGDHHTFIQQPQLEPLGLLLMKYL